MEDNDPEAKSVQVSTTQHPTDSTDEEEDEPLANPDPGRHRVSTSDLRNDGKNWNPWWANVYGGLPKRKTRDDRCNQCPTCRNVSKNGCGSKGDPIKCFGCINRTTCWKMLPCELWNEMEEAGHYAQFSLQAYDNPSPTNRVDLITRNPYRLDLEANNTMLRLPVHPVT